MPSLKGIPIIDFLLTWFNASLNFRSKRQNEHKVKKTHRSPMRLDLLISGKLLQFRTLLDRTQINFDSLNLELNTTLKEYFVQK